MSPNEKSKEGITLYYLTNFSRQMRLYKKNFENHFIRNLISGTEVSFRIALSRVLKYSVNNNLQHDFHRERERISLLMIPRKIRHVHIKLSSLKIFAKKE